MSKKPRWDWKNERRNIEIEGRPLTAVAADLLAADKELREPRAFAHSYGVQVDGWVPITDPKELAVAKARKDLAEKERAKKIAKDRAADLRIIARLAAKHGLGALPPSSDQS